VCLEIGRVDRDHLGRGARSGQSFHHAQEHAPLAPPLPPVVEGLGRSVLPGRIAPTQPVAVYEDDAAQHPPIINPGLAEALGKYGSSRAICSSVSQYRSFIASLLAEPESDRASHINGS